MTRYERFLALKDHPMLGKLHCKLTVPQRVLARDFLLEREKMTDEQYLFDAIAFGLGTGRPSDKDVWALLMQSVEPKVRQRRQ